jgi:hypothetical protein
MPDTTTRRDTSRTRPDTSSATLPLSLAR